MRITTESLLRIARETTSVRTHTDKGIVAVYLTGSLRSENPFLGGTTDIDLVFVHEKKPTARHEVVPLNPEIHIDIKHNPRSEYDTPRQLRIDPWLGPELWDPLLLYEREHFFEFVQAAVRDKFHDTVNVIARARQNLNHARQIWTGMQRKSRGRVKSLLTYLKAVHHAANAVAILNGDVLAERRCLLQFPTRAEAAGDPSLYEKLIILLGGQNANAEALSAYLPAWEESFTEAGSLPNADARLHPARLLYYKAAMRVLLESEDPLDVLWPMLNTWTLAASALPAANRKNWEKAIQLLGMKRGLLSQLEDLDHFLDRIEIILENAAAKQGIDTIYRDGRKVN